VYIHLVNTETIAFGVSRVPILNQIKSTQRPASAKIYSNGTSEPHHTLIFYKTFNSRFLDLKSTKRGYRWQNSGSSSKGGLGLQICPDISFLL
jgi:hypothetical protein